MNRCEWVGKDEIYLNYHDQEWGVAVFDSELLFQHLLLDGVQAGLSWITVLKKRENYRQIFHNFDPIKIAKMTDQELNNILLNPAIIRNKLKVYGFRKNALAYLKLTKEQTFSDFLWSFVNNKIINNHYTCLADIPTNDNISLAMSKELKKRGFTFVGTTICYAFMEAVGMIDNHTTACFRYKNKPQ